MTIIDMQAHAVQAQFHPVVLAIKEFANDHTTAIALVLGVFALWLLKDDLNMLPDDEK
jgi:hypothetical protein